MPGRFAERYTDEQRSAFLHAVLDSDGPHLSVAAAVRAAHAGELEGLEAFAISTSYAQQLVRRERARARGEAPDQSRSTPKDRLARTIRKATLALEADVDKIAATSAQTGKAESQQTRPLSLH
jgi:hypothetical protein